MTNLLDLIETSVTLASNANGRAQAITGQQQSWHLERVQWLHTEEEYLRANWGKKPIAQIAKHLGRSYNAVLVRAKRLRLGPMKDTDEELTAREVATILGKGCGKSISLLIKQGILPARTLPMDALAYIVTRTNLTRWAIQPQNWIYFNAHDMPESHLKHLVLRQQSRWPDKWLTPGEVAAWHGVDHRMVNKQIHDGRLPAIRWGNWYILQSDSLKTTFPYGKGSNTTVNYTDDGDTYLLLAYAIGVPLPHIAHNLGWGNHKSGIERARLRAQTLCKKHNITTTKLLLQKYGLDNIAWQNNEPYADWRDHHSRFPGLQTAVRHFLAHKPLNYNKKLGVWGILRRWCEQHHNPATDTPQLTDIVRRLKYGNTMRQDTLYHIYTTISPFYGDPFIQQSQASPKSPDKYTQDTQEA